MKLGIQELVRNIFINRRKRGTYRTDLIKEIMDTINSERLGTKFKQVKFIQISEMVRHLDDNTVAYTVSICKDSRRRTGSFSKCFFGSLKVRKGHTIKKQNTKKPEGFFC